MTTDEEWRSIPSFPGYEASGHGGIRSHVTYRGNRGPRQIAASPDADGYLRVHLHCPDGRSKVVRVHVLVMLAFVGERERGWVIRHLDGDALNNSIENLSYGTASQNSFDQVAHGTHPFASRTQCKHGHEYTTENTAIFTSSAGRPFRQCITCNRARRRRQLKSKAVA